MEQDCRAIECIRGYCYCYCRRDTNKKGLVLGLLTFVQSEEVCHGNHWLVVALLYP